MPPRGTASLRCRLTQDSEFEEAEADDDIIEREESEEDPLGDSFMKKLDRERVEREYQKSLKRTAQRKKAEREGRGEDIISYGYGYAPDSDNSYVGYEDDIGTSNLKRQDYHHIGESSSQSGRKPSRGRLAKGTHFDESTDDIIERQKSEESQESSFNRGDSFLEQLEREQVERRYEEARESMTEKNRQEVDEVSYGPGYRSDSEDSDAADEYMVPKFNHKSHIGVSYGRRRVPVDRDEAAEIYETERTPESSNELDRGEHSSSSSSSSSSYDSSGSDYAPRGSKSKMAKRKSSRLATSGTTNKKTYSDAFDYSGPSTSGFVGYNNNGSKAISSKTSSKKSKSHSGSSAHAGPPSFHGIGTSKSSQRRTARGRGRQAGILFTTRVRETEKKKGEKRKQVNKGKPTRGRGCRGGKIAQRLCQQHEQLKKKKETAADQNQHGKVNKQLLAAAGFSQSHH